MKQPQAHFASGAFAMPGWLRVAGAAWLVLALAFPTLPAALQASLWSSTEENSSEREEDPLPEVRDLVLEALSRLPHSSRPVIRNRPDHLDLRPLNKAVERPAAASELSRRNGVGSVLRC